MKETITTLWKLFCWMFLVISEVFPFVNMRDFRPFVFLVFWLSPNISLSLMSKHLAVSFMLQTVVNSAWQTVEVWESYLKQFRSFFINFFVLKPDQGLHLSQISEPVQGKLVVLVSTLALSKGLLHNHQPSQLLQCCWTLWNERLFSSVLTKCVIHCWDFKRGGVSLTW